MFEIRDLRRSRERLKENMAAKEAQLNAQQLEKERLEALLADSISTVQALEKQLQSFAPEKKRC